jgi:hypothetical protein
MERGRNMIELLGALRLEICSFESDSEHENCD